MDFVTTRWRHDHDTRAAVGALAYLGETHLDMDLGRFVGLNDERNGNWGRFASDVEAAATLELDRYLHRPR